MENLETCFCKEKILNLNSNILQVETKEAQEANLLNLYTAALKSIAAGNIKVAKANLSEIISSPIFQVYRRKSNLKKRDNIKYFPQFSKNLGFLVKCRLGYHFVMTCYFILLDVGRKGGRTRL